MKRFLISGVLVVLLSISAAYVTYLVLGPPDRSVACNPDSLPKHHVCLSTVREWPVEEVLWVDARPRADWERDGVEGSILLNDQEDWLDLEPDFVFQMTLSPRPRVVVYCNQSGCGSSTYVANQLREKHADDYGLEIFVLEGGSSALANEGG